MLAFLLLTSVPVPPLDHQARRVVEAQLLSSPRDSGNSGLSGQEADVIRSRYLQSIGQRPPQPADQRDTAGR